jgi:succinate-semialdehyde dehydrogenase/glutarate-semialdehyde dehydrogenase
MASITSLNPATGEVLKEYEAHSAAEWGRIVDATAATQRDWAAAPLDHRVDLLDALGAHLRANLQEYGRLMALEMGKPITQAIAEIEKSATCCDYYVERAAGLLADEVVVTDALFSAVQQLPLGVVLAIMPWNYPFWQAIRAVVPAIVAGNAVVLKHASNVPQSALALEAAFEASGFPANLFSAVLVPGSAAAGLIRHDGIAAVTLTGSEGAGRQVAAVAGEVLKKAVLELGGSDPFIVRADADVAAAGAAAAQSRVLNNGQSCIAAKRFIVAEQIYDEFLDVFAAEMSALVVGDQLDSTTQLGPLARADLRDELHEQLERTLRQGGRLVLGGIRPDGPGAYYPATIVADVTPGMTAFDEEVFGPVASVTPAASDAVMIELANTSPYGLGSAIFTADTDEAQRIGKELHTGMVFVNGIVKSDPRLPFGGVKASGYGRELGTYGLYEFLNTRTLWIR